MIPFVTLKNTTRRHEHSNDTSVTKETLGFSGLSFLQGFVVQIHI